MRTERLAPGRVFQNPFGSAGSSKRQEQEQYGAHPADDNNNNNDGDDDVNAIKIMFLNEDQWKLDFRVDISGGCELYNRLAQLSRATQVVFVCCSVAVYQV